MQAAGRLRQLGRGQTLQIVGIPNTTAKIVEITGEAVPKSLHVLQWVMHNTIQATLNGISDWSEQGIHFAATKEHPERAELTEKLSLELLYGIGKTPRSIAAVVQNIIAERITLCEGGLADGMQDHVQTIMQLSLRYGSKQVVHAGGAADAECEMEMEQEAEEEKEVERELPPIKPTNESHWQYHTALTASHPMALRSVTTILNLQDFALMLQPEGVQKLDWSKHVYCTTNFSHSVGIHQSLPSHPGVWNDYLRPLNWILLFPKGEVLLVSEREADALLELLWTPPVPSETSVPTANPLLTEEEDSSCSLCSSIHLSPLLVNLCYASVGFNAAACTAPQPNTSLASPHFALAVYPRSAQALHLGDIMQAPKLAVHEIVSLQLLNGHASYGAEQYNRLHGMIKGQKAVARALVDMRGKLPLFPSSKLEEACAPTFEKLVITPNILRTKQYYDRRVSL